ncbi:uncharacterized protein LOC116772121 [Danaus plexippus]|uniref:uncharacterized protein LOC116772121 n=1 Tax=Danaus plexippus TaxID=13037 RepID=UPI002AB24348|nr:uncharacterized protein LOC116772121 [Danaus plexippus]
MWYPWIALLVSSALVGAETTEGPTPATTRAPPRTLDRPLGELAWPTWLQNPDEGNQNAPPRRITTKSLFITPLVCPKGHRLDGAACVQVVTVNKDEHERILLEQLNALHIFTAAPNNSDVFYDYGDEEPGPLQLSIPIGLDPQVSPQDPSAQNQDLTPNFGNNDKNADNTDIEAELELLKLQQAHNKLNQTAGNNILSHNALHNLLTYSDKPKRDSPMINSSEVESLNSTDEGQKEVVYGHVNVDPVLYDTINENNEDKATDLEIKNDETSLADKDNSSNKTENDTTLANFTDYSSNTTNTTKPVLKNTEETKLNPENDYSDIGEAIKLISRYAEVSTDDNFTKDDKKDPSTEDSVLGTRTKLQYRRKKPIVSFKLNEQENPTPDVMSSDVMNDRLNPKNVVLYRYPWPSESAGVIPPNYPFRRLQDYWPGRSQIGGLYRSENPRRHHHTYPHYFRPRGYNYAGYHGTRSGLQEAYSRLRRYPHKLEERNASPVRSHATNQDLYSLLGLRHWFSGEGTSKR